MSVISQEVWNKVVKDSPYVHISYELYADEQYVELYEDEAREKVIDKVWQPNMYAKALGSWKNNPYRYFNVYSAIHMDADYVGEIFYTELDLDTDYYALEDVGATIEDMEHLIDFLNTHIPEKALIKNKIKLVEELEE